IGARRRDAGTATAQLLPEQPTPQSTVHGLPLQSRDAHKKARPRELFLLVVLAQYVANVLAETTFDALAELLDAVHVSLVDFPFGVRPRLEGENPLVDAEIPGDVGDQILDERKRLHRQDGDGLVQGQGVHARLASEPRTSVYFSRARTALSCFAVPAHCQVGSEVALDVVQRIQNDHARG